MTIRRVGDYWDDLLADMKVCVHPEHPLPQDLVLEAGMYEHTCPGCGHVLRFRRLPELRPARAVSELVARQRPASGER
jgi:hypothetical protein